MKTHDQLYYKIVNDGDWIEMHISSNKKEIIKRGSDTLSCKIGPEYHGDKNKFVKSWEEFQKTAHNAIKMKEGMLIKYKLKIKRKER